MADPQHAQGLIDTSVVIDLEHIDAKDLPQSLAVSAITIAELSAGPHATDDTEERARRQDRLQRTTTTFEALPFDDDAARAYALVYAAVVRAGRRVPGRRAFDLLIAAAAVARGLPLYTRNPSDFAGLDGVLEVVATGPTG